MTYRVLGESFRPSGAALGSGKLDAQYFSRILSMRPSNLAAYWPLWETELGDGSAEELSGNEITGTYRSAGVPDTSFIFGADGIGDGRTSVRVDLANPNSSVAIGGAALDAVWNGDLFSIISWGVLNPSYWSGDAVFRYLPHLRATNSDLWYVVMGKPDADNTLVWRRRSGGAVVQQLHTYATPPADFFCMGMTLDIAANPQLSIYLWDSINGFQVVNEFNNAALNAWGVHPLTDNTKSILMAGSSTSQEWIGSGAHMAIWTGIKLTTNEMRHVMSKNK